ncbi:MAG: hypothetical protein AOA65_0006 [Candidatus Bathyarchaeota archaeon BA1]|nr:MAG: hypothetical protein AOA65_0006 [Candidatus Bathyarchaeota archaeon BA1]
MGKIQVHIKAPFGEIVVEGNNPQEILEMIRAIPPDFMSEMGGLISAKFVPPIKAQLEGIVELTTEGPIITTRQELTHYEAIGLVLYASDEKRNTAAHISRLIEVSGIKCQVPARLNEMAKRAIVFKPNPAMPEWKLTTQGEKWITDEVLPKLRGTIEGQQL